jgi:molybdopterin molybdotransferase
VIEEIPAGAWPTQSVEPGTCARILTGAPVPAGADCVIMQEQTRREGDTIHILKDKTSDNICLKGEDVKSGDRVLERGVRIGPAHIAVLAAVGAATVRVVRRPRVAVLATGSELVESGQVPDRAQIRNSNGPQLLAQLGAMGVEARDAGIIEDTHEATHEAIAAAMDWADLILLSGGVSTGDYDLVPGILSELGVELLFDSVAMQPGRPTVFGRKGNVYCCGLPGNPVSTYVIFELLAKPFLYRLQGHVYCPVVVEARLAETVKRRKTVRRTAVPVRFTEPSVVERLDYHGSAHIHAMTRADGVLFMEVGQAEIPAGEVVHVRSFPA